MIILKDFKSIIFFIFIGLLMSPMSSYVSQTVFSLPIVAPEILYLPLLFKYYDRFGISLEKTPKFSKWIILTFILFLFALMHGSFEFVALASAVRCFLWLFMFIEIAMCVSINENLLHGLLWISIGSLLGWCLCNHFMVQTTAYLMGYGVLYGNMVVIPYAFAIALIYEKKNWALLLVVALNIYLCGTSGLRRQISVTVISFALSFLISSIGRKEVKKIIISSTIVFLVFTLLPFFEETIAEFSPLVHDRLFLRTENALGGNMSDGDQTRYNFLMTFLDDSMDLIIPHGFVSFQATKGVTGFFADAPYYMLSYVFGIVTFVVFIILYLVKIIKKLKELVFRKDVFAGLVLIASSVVFFLLFVDYTMFSFSYTVPFTGLTIGLLFRQYRNTSNYTK